MDISLIALERHVMASVILTWDGGFSLIVYLESTYSI